MHAETKNNLNKPFIHFLILFGPLSGLNGAHSQWGRQSALLSLQIQMLISSELHSQIHLE